MILIYNNEAIWKISQNAGKHALSSLGYIRLDEMESPLLLVSNHGKGLLFNPEYLLANAPPKYLMRLGSNEELIACIQIKKQEGFIQLTSSQNKSYSYEVKKLRLATPGTQGIKLSKLGEDEIILTAKYGYQIESDNH